MDGSQSAHAVVAGAVSGLVSRFFVAPLDVIKIRQQLHHSLADPSADRNLYRSVLSTLRAILRDEGLTALWKGNAPAELLYIVYGAVQFSVYRSLSHALAALPPAFRPPLAAESFAAGAVAGCAATAASYPLDLLRTRFAAQTVSALAYRRGAGSVFAAASRICRDEGVRGFFRGGSAAIGMVGPYMGLFFATYEALHPLLAGLPGALAAAPPHPLTAPLAMLVSPLSSADAAAGIAGTAASVTAKTAVFPLDLVRKRLQVQGPTRAAYAYGNVPEYRGVLSTVRTVVSQQGLRGLYRGLPISLAKAAPTSAITMWTYELTLRYLQ